MARVFHRSTNTLARVSVFGFVFLLAGIAWATITIGKSLYLTNVNVAQLQPVPFSHEHHVNGVGLDCRYYHNSVEKSAFAGIPATQSCMNCHSQVWPDSPLLQPVRESYRPASIIQTPNSTIQLNKEVKAMNQTTAKRLAKESLAMLMVGDAMVTLVDPQRHCRLWMKGPEGWRRFIQTFVEHPGITRGLALAELGLGVWLAEKQKPVKATAH